MQLAAYQHDHYFELREGDVSCLLELHFMNYFSDLVLFVDPLPLHLLLLAFLLQLHQELASEELQVGGGRL